MDIHFNFNFLYSLLFELWPQWFYWLNFKRKGEYEAKLMNLLLSYLELFFFLIICKVYDSQIVLMP